MRGRSLILAPFVAYLAACGGSSDKANTQAPGLDASAAREGGTGAQGHVDASTTMDGATSGGGSGSGQDGSTLPLDPLTLDAFCSGVLDSTLAWLDRCQPGTGYNWPDWGTLYAQCQRAPSEIEMGRATFDGQAAARCVALNEAADCKQGPATSYARVSVEHPCKEVFVGAVPLGAACYADALILADECAGGSCRHNAGQCPGKCDVYAQAGGMCDGGGAPHCVPPLYCGADKKCIARGQLGEACSGQFDSCEAGLSCPYVEGSPYRCVKIAKALGDACDGFRSCPIGSGCYQGTCIARQPLGAQCAFDIVCVDGLVCAPVKEGDVVLSRCRAPFQPGAECLGIEPVCSGGLSCYARPGEAKKTCQALGSVGTPCDSSKCQPGLTCNYGGGDTCVTRGKAGDTCNPIPPDACLENLYCLPDQKCHAAGSLGQACDLRDHRTCQSGGYCFDTGSGAKCVAARTAGQTCLRDGFQNMCTSGLYCAVATNTCVPQVADGTACTSDFACTSGNCPDWGVRVCSSLIVGRGFTGCMR